MRLDPYITIIQLVTIKFSVERGDNSYKIQLQYRVSTWKRKKK